MNHNKLKSALAKFKDVTVKEQITGDYTPEEINEIWGALNAIPPGETHNEPNEQKQGAGSNETVLKELEAQKAENERLQKLLGGEGEKPKQTVGAKRHTGGRNSGFKIPQFTGRMFQGTDFEAYQEVVRGLDQRTLYDWTEYKAVGIWNQIEDPETGDMKQGGILKGIELVDSNPLKHTAMQPSHIEYWMTGQRGRKVMGGMNAQIYDKSNNRANSRFFLLRGAAPEQEQ